MIRRAFDERRVLLDRRDDNVFQLVLPLNEFRSFVDDRHILPPYELSASLDAGKTLCKKERVFRSLGWSDPMIFLGSRRLPKVGSLQPSSVFCPRPKSTAAPCATSTLSTISRHVLRDAKGDG